jgi:hypothetical protein
MTVKTSKSALLRAENACNRAHSSPRNALVHAQAALTDLTFAMVEYPNTGKAMPSWFWPSLDRCLDLYAAGIKKLQGNTVRRAATAATNELFMLRRDL